VTVAHVGTTVRARSAVASRLPSGVTSPPLSAPPPHTGYRPFLDGLRAFAVVGVLVYHLDRTWLPGGYLGVDLFFVLSGYLITSLLLAEHARTGRIDLPAFWSRRVRRLLPALLVVLVVMAIVIEAQGDVLAIGAARGDLLSTLFYVANWHFILSGQSYFSQYLSASPDKHTWSLAIEEQFYLVWPVIVAFVLARFRTRTLALIAICVTLSSALLMAALFRPRDPSRAYYGTDTRIFEILVGALTAIAMQSRLRVPVERWGRRLAWPAAAVLTLAFIALADDSALYYLGGALGLSLAAAF
jgi:peptidoglycan/LPS O-acetylase OafA/YrhL